MLGPGRRRPTVFIVLALVASATWADDEVVKTLPIDELQCPKGQLATTVGCIPFPKAKKKPDPKYPRRAREAKVTEARVVIRCVIDRQGRVTKPVVEHSTQPGYGFEKAAVNAVGKWRYGPVVVEGEPINLEFYIQITFQLLYSLNDRGHR